VTRLVIICVAGCLLPGWALAQPGSAGHWSRLEVPGSYEVLSEIADLKVPPERFLLDFVGLGDYKSVPRVLEYLDAQRRLRSFLTPGEREITITLRIAGSKPERDLRELCRLFGLTLTKARSGFRVERSAIQPIDSSHRLTDGAGVSVDEIEQRLNGGHAVRVRPPTMSIPLPLTPLIWSQVIFDRLVPPDRLFDTLISDRPAGLLYRGLLLLDPETRTFLSERPKLLSRLYHEHASAFGGYGSAFRVRRGHVDVPGGDEGLGLWKWLVEKDATEPEAFLLKILDADGGRLAFFYHALSNLDSSHVRFAMGLGSSTPIKERQKRFGELYGYFKRFEPDWDVMSGSLFRRALDPSLLLAEVRVDANGGFMPPASRGLWEAVFESRELPAPSFRDPIAGDALDAAFLVGKVFQGRQYDFPERLNTVLFAQRVFHSRTNGADIVTALRGFRRFPVLFLTLERMRIVDPGIHALAARRAETLSAIANADRTTRALSQFQGALALLERVVGARSLPPDAAIALAHSLVAVDLDQEGTYNGGIAAWFQKDLLPALPRGPALDATPDQMLLAAIAGDRSFGAPAAVKPWLVTWERERYEFVPGEAVRERIEKIRGQQRGNSLRNVLALSSIASELVERPPLDRVPAIIQELQRLQKDLAEPRPPVRLTDEESPKLARILADAIRDTTRIRQAKDLPRLTRAGNGLRLLADHLLADALRSIVYAVSLPESEMNATLFIAGDISFRHDFGLSHPQLAHRERLSWTVPSEGKDSGSEWQLQGSLLAADLPTAALAGGRLATLLAADSLSARAAEGRSLLSTLALFDPSDTTSDDLREIADMLAAGRTRVESLRARADELEDLLRNAGTSSASRMLVHWAIENGSIQDAIRVLSLRELVRIGSPDRTPVRIDGWGARRYAVTGCLCLEFGGPVPWDLYDQRLTSLGYATAQVPDLLLRIAELMAELKLDPILARALLPRALQDMLDRARPAHADDWMAIAQAASSLTRSQMEDYMWTLTNERAFRPLASANK
jgi:hypothetical protein